MADEKSPLLIKSGSMQIEVYLPEIPKPKTSWIGASLILANIVLGSGLLNFPNVYNQAGGIASAICTEIVCLFLVEAAMLLIAYCADIAGTDAYQDVVDYFTGPIGNFFSNLFIVIHNFGTCVTFLVIIADQIDQVMLHTFGPSFCHSWYLHRYFTLSVVATILILPLCFPKNIASFKIGSVLGILTTFYLLMLVMYQYFLRSKDDYGEEVTDDKEVSVYDTDEVLIKTRPDSWLDVVAVIPMIVFSFEAHIESVPLYASLTERNLKYMTRSLCGATAICFVVYNIVGIFGFLTFGNGVNTDILTSYQPIDVSIIIGIAMMAFKCIMTYPVVFFCARMVVMEVTSNACRRFCSSDTVLRVSCTVVMFFTSLVIALFVPSIGTVISLLGGTAALFIFVFPGLCFMLAHNPANSASDQVKRAIGFCFCVFGFFIIGSTTVQSVQNFLMYGSETEVHCQ